MGIVIGKKGGRPSKMPPADELLRLYEKHTSTEIGKVYGVSSSTVRTWVARLKKKGVEQK